MHNVDMRCTKGSQREPENIFFTEADDKWVHHPHIDTLVITVKIANSIVHRMLVDNGKAVNIVFVNAYQKIGLTRCDLSTVTSPPYRFTRGHVIPKGAIKLATTLGNYPRVSIVVAEFLTIECPSAFNRVIGKLLLKSLKAITSIHYLTMKFPTAEGIGQV